MIVTAVFPSSYQIQSDTTAPVMSGAVVATSITTSSSDIAWPAATDNVSVAGYEYSTSGGTSYINAGENRAVSLAGLSPDTTYSLRARAYDPAGNRSNSISGTFSTLPADSSTIPGVVDASKVPPERRVVFEGSIRVVSFPGSIQKVRF